MFHFARLETEEQWASFKRGYDSQMAQRSNGRVKSVVSLEYLRAATRPMGCFNRRGELVAGWVVQEGDPLIALAAMPHAERQAFLCATPREEVCELTAIWRDQRISAGMFAALVWPRIVVDCVTRGRSCILGIGYRNTMNEIYSRLSPRLLYHGPSQTLADTDVYVYGYTRTVMCATLVSNLVARKLVPAAQALLRRAQALVSNDKTQTAPP